MPKNDVLKGLEDASKLLVDELRGGGSAITVFFKNVKLREGFAKVLTKLGEEVARETAGNAGTLTSATNELIRYAVVQLFFMNLVVCGCYILFDNMSSTELNKHCERVEKGDKKMSKSSHSVVVGLRDEAGAEAIPCNNSLLFRFRSSM